MVCVLFPRIFPARLYQSQLRSHFAVRHNICFEYGLNCDLLRVTVNVEWRQLLFVFECMAIGFRGIYNMNYDPWKHSENMFVVCSYIGANLFGVRCGPSTCTIVLCVCGYE